MKRILVELIGTGRGQLSMDQVDSDQAGAYACGDVEATFELADLLRPEIHQANMDDLLYEIEQPLVPVLIEMEGTGIAVDVPYLEELSREITARLHEVEAELQELAGRPINPNSAKQLAPLLFEELKLPSGREGWAPEGILAFSKICTHAGCAINLYRYPLYPEAEPRPALVCPCHYSTFDPATGGGVIFGPAGRPLPQLPLAICSGGVLRAAGNFSAPVGPSWAGVRDHEPRNPA